MPFKISPEKEQLILSLHGQGVPAKTIAKTAECSLPTTYRIVRNFEHFRTPRPPQSAAGRPRKLTVAILEGIQDFIDKHNSSYLDEIVAFVLAEYAVEVTEARISQLLKEKKITRNKLWLVPWFNLDRKRIPRTRFVSKFLHTVTTMRDGTASPSALVARFLRQNNYTDTLATFIKETGLPDDVGSSDGWTIENIIKEKKAFDKSLNFERAGDESSERDRWAYPAPSQPTMIETPRPSNLLSGSVLPIGELDGDGKNTYSVVATDASKHLNFFDVTREHDLTSSSADMADSPILSCISINDGKYLAMTSMSGKLIVSRGFDILDTRKEHTKYAVQVAAHDDNSRSRTWLATAGWDGKVFIYCMNWTQTPLIGDPLDVIKLTTNPECCLFIMNKETGDLLLLASRRDSTFLDYYLVESAMAPLTTESRKSYQCRFLGKQNLAPQSNAWVAFSPSCLALSPHDPELLAVATSALPHMKVIIVRLLIPATDEVSPRYSQDQTHAAQALASLAIQNREDAAILVQTSTMAPQTEYSTPQVAWRPDGSGVWVNGDDGVIRGIETKTGKIVATLTKGHTPGAKIRSIWAGWVHTQDDTNAREEWLISGGFDKRLIVWKIRDDADNS